MFRKYIISIFTEIKGIEKTKLTIVDIANDFYSLRILTNTTAGIIA